MLPPKDYYNTLNIAPNASAQQIKHAYRKLAMQFHPDKHKGDRYMQAFFHEIQEAYEVLSHPQNRAQYHQKRWYHLSTGKKFANSTPKTPFSLLQEVVKLYDHVQEIDIFRMDSSALLSIFQQMVSKENVAMLFSFNDNHTRAQIFNVLLQCCIHFTPIQLAIIEPAMMELANQEPAFINKWKALLNKQSQHQQWNTYRWLVILVLSLSIATMLYWLGK